MPSFKGILKGILGTVAPVAATAIGGPFGGMAARMAASALGIDVQEGETTDKVEAKLASKLEAATPDDLLKLKKLDADLKVKLKELDLDEAKLQQLEEEQHRLDRESAREREIKTGDTTPAILAYIIVGTFLGLLAGQFFLIGYGVKVEPIMLRLLDTSTGILLAMVTGVINYFFGSSAGSKFKTSIMANGGATK